MAYIPAGAKWYLADLVVAISVAKHRTVTVHINTVLVRADSPADAYREALKLGQREESGYANAAGERVTFRFLGLRDLNVIHDDFEHGAELSYSKRSVRSVARAKKLVNPKRALGVFRPRIPSKAPDYMSGDIRRALESAFPSERARGKRR